MKLKKVELGEAIRQGYEIVWRRENTWDNRIIFRPYEVDPKPIETESGTYYKFNGMTLCQEEMTIYVEL